MTERGFSLVEAVIALGVMAIVLASGVGVVIALPRQASRWEHSAEARQRVRVLDARIARLAANAAPWEVAVAGTAVHVPGIWPRRLGLTRAGAPLDAAGLTFLSRPDAHRTLVLDEPLGAAGGVVTARGGPGCGTAPMCRVREGDLVLAVSDAGALALYRVTDVGIRLSLDPLMSGPVFAAGAVLVPVSLASLEFEAATGELRVYDGYRSDNVLVDGLAALSVTFQPEVALGNGPWAGAGALTFDTDQLDIRGVRAEVAIVEESDRGVETARLAWGVR